MGTDSSAVLSVLSQPTSSSLLGENTTTLASTIESKRSSPNTTTSTTTGNQRSSSTTAYPQMSRQIHRSMRETLPRQSMEILSTITPLMCLPLLSVCLSIEAVEERYKTMQIKILPFINTQ